MLVVPAFDDPDLDVAGGVGGFIGLLFGLLLLGWLGGVVGFRLVFFHHLILLQTFHFFNCFFSVVLFAWVLNRSRLIGLFKHTRFIIAHFISLVMIVANAVMLIPFHLVRNQSWLVFLLRWLLRLAVKIEQL